MVACLLRDTEDANSKLVVFVTVADVDAEDHVGNSLLQFLTSKSYFGKMSSTLGSVVPLAMFSLLVITFD